MRFTNSTVATFCALCLLFAGNAVAQTVFENGSFELGDGVSPFVPGTGDVAGTPSQSGPDWDDLFRFSGRWKDVYNEFGESQSNGVPDFLDVGGPRRVRSDAGFVGDDVSAGTHIDSSVFVGPTLVGAGTVDAQFDLSNTYAHTTFDRQGRLLMYAGFERIAGGSGSTVFEFTRNLFSIGDGGEIVGERVTGDLRVQADYVGQGLVSLSVSQWKEDPQQPGAFDWALVELLPVGQSDPVEQCNDLGSVCIVCNLGSIDGGPWSNFDDSGEVVTDIVSNHFLEFGIDLTSVLGLHNYANFYETRYAGIQITTFDDATPDPDPQDYAVGSFVRASKLAGR